MTKYEYDDVTPGSLLVEDGTQQAPALLNYLRHCGGNGWHVVVFVGDPNDDFWVLLERSVSADG